MSRRRSQVDDSGKIEEEIINWYRAELEKPAVLPSSKYTPIRIGPTWQIEDGHWVLPKLTLGWDVLAWWGVNLQLSKGVEFRATMEQARFILWWYALDADGRFLYRDAVLQRLKGWGKDPLGAAWSAVEMCGPCRFGDWISDGVPLAVPSEQPWIQTAAVALEQTKNTLKLFPVMFTDEAKAKYRLQILREKVHGLNGALIEAVTSNPAAMEGARATAVLKNETQHWTARNSGHEMAAVIERNATKGAGGLNRTLAITNAYMPGEDSTAEQDRESFDKVTAGATADAGLLYDSLEAPPDAPLTAEAAPEVVKGVRGDSVWLDVDTIVKSIIDSRNPPSRSRRFWYNQIVAAEDAWVTPQQWERLQDDDLPALQESDDIAMFLDTSKSDDATGLVACRLSDGTPFVLGCWQKDVKRDGKDWVVPRGEVDYIVRQAKDLYNVRGFFADPTPGDDETGERYFDVLIQEWDRLFANDVLVKASPTQAVRWPLSGGSSQHQREFTEATGATLAEIQAGAFKHDGNKLLNQHIRNARRRPSQHGVAIGKEHRESSRKIDLAVCMIGARMVRSRVIATDKWQRKQRGQGRRPLAMVMR